MFRTWELVAIFALVLICIGSYLSYKYNLETRQMNKGCEHCMWCGERTYFIKRVGELEAAIKKHRDHFPDESLDGERELWLTISDNFGKSIVD